MRAPIVLALLLAFPVAAADTDDQVKQLLRRARMTHEPTRHIREAVEIFDKEIDAHPAEVLRWRQLAEALEIGWARSRHAASPGAAWRRAHELAPDDCHLAGLVARIELNKDPKAPAPPPTLAAMLALPSPCADAPFLEARRDPKNALALLERSRAIQPTAEGLVALGQAEAARRRWPAAEIAWRAALTAPALFPEDWRVDGWTIVHAHLGLAYAALQQGRVAAAKQSWKEAGSFLDDPGPWHDLSDEEQRWQKTLQRKLGPAIRDP